MERLRKVSEVKMKDKPNKVTTVLKVVVAGEFYDDDATEETLRYAVEQDLEDAGFDVDVAVLKEQEAKTGKWIPIESPTGVKAFGVNEMTVMDVRCSVCGSEEDVSFTGYKYCPRCGTKMKGR